MGDIMKFIKRNNRICYALFIIHFAQLVNSVPAFRLEYGWIEDLPNIDDGVTSYDENFQFRQSEHFPNRNSKRDELSDDAKRLYNDKFNIEDPNMNAMQGSILMEQRNEMAALKDDSAFEDTALASLQDDERKMEADEGKVDEDRRRKFGKHKKRWKNTDEEEKEKQEPDVYTKIREFSDSISPPQRTHRKIRDKRDKIPQYDDDVGGLDFRDDVLRSYANDRHKNSYVNEIS